MQPEDSAALRLQTSHLQGFNQATVQSHTWSNVYHSALLVWEVDADSAASLGVGHLAVI